MKNFLGPDFDAHLTLSGPINYNESHNRKNFLNLSKRFSKLKLKLSGIGYKENYFQSLFLVVENTDELNSLKKSIDEKTGFPSKRLSSYQFILWQRKRRFKKNLCRELVI